MFKRIILGSVLSALAISSSAEPGLSEYDFWDKDYAVQALLGGMKYKDLEFNLENGQTVKADLSAIPQVGGAWATLPRGKRLQYGLETSFLLGMRFKSLDYLQIGSGLNAQVSISLWTFDLAGGGYASLFLDKNRKVRIYGAAGPMMMFAAYDEDKDLSDSTSSSRSDSAFGMGLYARAGVEFRIFEYGMLGFGARSIYADVDLSDVGGTTDVVGIAGFITFMAGF